jgi:DNA polymerase-3 subunit delta'
MSFHLENSYFQSKAANHLRRIIDSKRIPHALLFRGPNGVGKHFTALQFAKDLNSSLSNSASINTKIDNLEEPNLKFVVALPRGSGESSDDKPTAKLNEQSLENIRESIDKKRKNPFEKVIIEKAQNIKISSIREIRKFLSFNFESDYYRVIILHECHKMSIDSQNALLKNLEEPPEHTVFILHTSEYYKLLPTIRSRCQEIVFNPLEVTDLRKIIKEYYDFDDLSVDIASKFSEGSVTNAVDLLQNNLNEYIEKCINILRFSLARRFNTAFEYLEDVIKLEGSKGFYICLDLIIKWFLDVMRVRNKLEPNYFTDQISTINKFNERFNDIDIDTTINKLTNISSLRDTNINLNICISNVIFEIGHIGIGYSNV